VVLCIPRPNGRGRLGKGMEWYGPTAGGAFIPGPERISVQDYPNGTSGTARCGLIGKSSAWSVARGHGQTHLEQNFLTENTRTAYDH
jgi:hypothetical protein